MNAKYTTRKLLANGHRVWLGRPVNINAPSRTCAEAIRAMAVAAAERAQ